MRIGENSEIETVSGSVDVLPLMARAFPGLAKAFA